jgi:N-acetylmuramoyl-L-alanine amidase
LRSPKFIICLLDVLSTQIYKIRQAEHFLNLLIFDNNFKICQCKVNRLTHNQDEQAYLINPDTEEMAEFLGVSENGIAIAENILGETQFYVILAKKYMGTNDVCLVYDVEGNLMQGTETITHVNPDSKPLVVNLMGSNSYAIVTLGQDGMPYYHVVDMNNEGYGITDVAGAVVTPNLPLLGDSPVSLQYGHNFTGYEDHINGKTIVYGIRSKASDYPGEYNVELVAHSLSSTPGGIAQEVVLYSEQLCNNQQNGELQLSPQGDKLLWYKHDKGVSAFAHRTAQIYTFTLDADRLGVLAGVDIRELGNQGNYGTGYVEMGMDNNTVYTSSRGVYGETPQANKHVWQYSSVTELVLTDINPTDVYLFSQIKRGLDGNMYMPNLDNPVNVLHTYSPNLDATSEMTGFTTDINAPYTFSSSLPTQVFKVYAKNNATTNYSRIIGEKSYELNDHLGNIRVVISDRKYLADRDDSNTITTGDNFVPEVLSANEYGAGGMMLPGRSGNSGSYRYGLNGMEKVDEISGEGNHYTAEYWEYDPRLIRRWNLDPVVVAWESGYAAFRNNPIMYNDPNGDCPDCPDETENSGGGDDKNKVAIDAGHGIKGSNNSAMDPGAVGNGQKESDLALNISKSINTNLKLFGEETLMIREGDITVDGNSLTFRTDKAKEEGANIFVSIHINAAGNENAQGFTVLYKNSGTNASNNKALAESISGNQKTMSIRGSGITERSDLSVLNRFSSTGPAVLVEVGFITNQGDVLLMTASADQIGKEIAIGIFKYMNNGAEPVIPSPTETNYAPSEPIRIPPMLPSDRLHKGMFSPIIPEIKF